MSKSQTLPTDRSKHRRDNYWGTDDTAGELPSGHTEHTGTSRSEWVAKSILKHGADFICPIAMHEDADDDLAIHDRNGPVEVSEPEFFAVEDDDQQTTSYGLYPRRVNERHGYLSSGMIDNRTEDEFLGLIRDVADVWVARDEIGFGQQETVVEQARRMKTRGSLSDVRILTKLVQAVDADGTVADHFEN